MKNSIIIKKNDAFRVLQAITRGFITDVESHIINTLKSERMMSGDPEDCGQTIDDIRQANGTPMDYFLNVFFGRVPMKNEIPELIKHIEFVMDGSDNPCPECGCELNQETDAEFGVEYIDTDCSNPGCDYTNTTAPDWDMMPSGHDSNF